jgi:ABC-2 type transport system ATP-binding protein
MSYINVQSLTKDYKININGKGLKGALKSLLLPEYKIKRAVDNISFSINKGEMVGFVGPNGAGKSTTVKMLTGILEPTSGKILIDDLSPFKNRKKNAMKVGAVFGQKTQLWWDLPAKDSFDLLRRIYKISDDMYKHNMEVFNDILGLDEFIRQPVRQLSLGQRMRADIAAALIHDPEVIFFDEPTIGLDVVGKEKIREFIRYINKEKNITMLFTTHDMQDIEKTCNRMIIIDSGKLIYDGTTEEIKNIGSEERLLEVKFDKNYNIEEIPNVSISSKGNYVKVFKFHKDFPIPNLISELISNYKVVDLTIKEPEIEAIVRKIYEGDISIDESVYRVC